MKKIAITLMALAMFVLTIVSASALTITDVTVGDDNQDRIKGVTGTITVNNEDTVNSVTVALAFLNVDPKYNPVLAQTSLTLAPSASENVIITVDIPLDHDGVDSDLKETALQVGQITGTITGSTTPDATSNLRVQAVNQLVIDDARIECDDKSEKLDDGDDVKNLRPDMQCTVEVTAENKFDDKDDEDTNGNDLLIGDIEMEDLEVEIEIDDKDFDEDDDTDLDGLNADDKDEANLEFEIDEDVDDGTYDLIIRVIGTDENGAMHGEEWTVDLEVDRLTHDIQIKAPSLTPNKIDACEGGTIRVTSRIHNLGKRDEDETAVELEIPDLQISKRVDQIDLDEDDSTSVNFIADVPAGSKAGIYRAILSTYFDNIAPSNSEALEFTVNKCEDEPEDVVVTTSTGDATNAVQTGGDSTTPSATTGAVAVPRARTRSSGGFTESSGYLWLLGALGVVLLIIIMVLMAVAFRRPRQDVL